MNIQLKRQIEQEKRERTRSAYNNLIEANEKLVDKLRWIKEDIKRVIFKIETTNITTEEIDNDLNKILKNN